jgi:hypothetical protein
LLADECLERMAIERGRGQPEPGGVLRERGQIPPVAFEGMRRQPPLDAQMIEKRVNHGSV